MEQGTTTILSGVEDYGNFFPEIVGTRVRHFYPQDISDDGSLIVGCSEHVILGPGDSTPWIWDETNHFLTLPMNQDYTMPCAYLIDEMDGTIYGLAKQGEDWCKVKWVPFMEGDGVPIDIKPQSCPNPLNVNSKGVLPVAILGTDTFDVEYGVNGGATTNLATYVGAGNFYTNFTDARMFKFGADAGPAAAALDNFNIVPEPASTALCGIGALTLLLMRRRSVCGAV